MGRRVSSSYDYVLEVILPYLDTVGLARCACTSRYMRRRLGDENDKLWLEVLRREHGVEEHVACRTVKLLGGSFRALCASKASALLPTFPFVRGFDLSGGDLPTCVLRAQPSWQKVNELQEACVAAVDWLVSSGAEKAQQILWASPTCSLLCTKYALPSEKVREVKRNRNSGILQKMNREILQYLVRGESERNFATIEGIVSDIQESIEADCWAFSASPSCQRSRQPTLLSTQANASLWNYDATTDSSQYVERCRSFLMSQMGKDMLRSMLDQGCLVRLVMMSGGSPDTGVFYTYRGVSRHGHMRWFAKAEFNYPTNVHGLLCTLMEESQGTEAAPFAQPSSWDGWPWNLLDPRPTITQLAA